MKVLISEPDLANRALLDAALRHLGHEPVLSSSESFAAMVFDPGSSSSLAAAHAERQLRPGLPLVCVSHRTRTAAAAALDPSAYVRKPFTIAELRDALMLALR